MQMILKDMGDKKSSLLMIMRDNELVCYATIHYPI